MYEQFLFYWFIWIIFIIVAFFMEKGKHRSFLLFWILSILLFSSFTVQINELKINSAVIILIIGAIIFYVQCNLKFLFFLATFNVMICYVALLIWEKITPIWFFMPSYMQIPFMMVIMITIVLDIFYEQIAVTLLGFTLGQLLFELILFAYGLNDIVGAEIYFIHLSVIVLFLITLRYIHLIIHKCTTVVKRLFI